MSQENVELVRRAFQAFADEGVHAMAAFWDPDIRWRAAEGAIDDVGEMHGRVAVRRYIEDWLDLFENFSITVVDARAVGDDRVLSIQRATARAKLSGTEAELRYAAVITVGDGKILRVQEYLRVEDALAAVGLGDATPS